MTTRLLPADEWHKLAETDIARMLPYVTPETMQVVVVEDGDRIVGTWTVLTMTHLEGAWIHPDYRHRPSVARCLLTATLAVAQRVTSWAMTAATDDHVRRLLTKHLGAVAVPGEMFIVPVKGRQ